MMNGAAWQNAPDLLKLGLALFTVATIALVFLLLLTGWRWLAVAFAVIGMLVVLGIVRDANARDLDGRYAQSPLKGWFDKLENKVGALCCSDADGTAISDADWRSRGDKYEVFLEGEWHTVPDGALVTVPNLYGRTMVWPRRGYMGLQIVCFMPGAGI